MYELILLPGLCFDLFVHRTALVYWYSGEAGPSKGAVGEVAVSPYSVSCSIVARIHANFRIVGHFVEADLM